jgi:hypothetical protein
MPGFLNPVCSADRDPMASLLSKKLYFPCVAPNDRRSLMAANTRHNQFRLVAFERYLDAHEALEQARDGPLELVVGPMLRLDIAEIGKDVPTMVWNASALDIVNCGVHNFHLDVCCLRHPGVAEVLTSYSIYIEEPDAEIARMNLHISWEM